MWGPPKNFNHFQAIFGHFYPISLEKLAIYWHAYHRHMPGQKLKKFQGIGVWRILGRVSILQCWRSHWRVLESGCPLLDWTFWLCSRRNMDMARKKKAMRLHNISTGVLGNLIMVQAATAQWRYGMKATLMRQESGMIKNAIQIMVKVLGQFTHCVKLINKILLPVYGFVYIGLLPTQESWIHDNQGVGLSNKNPKCQIICIK